MMPEFNGNSYISMESFTRANYCEIHMEFNNGMWWAMPHQLSDAILQQWRNGAQQVSFVWDWGNTRAGSFELHGEETSINRYIIDFNTLRQRNIDNDRTRRVKVVHVLR